MILLIVLGFIFLPTKIVLGAIIGGVIGGVPGAIVGGIIGAFFI